MQFISVDLHGKYTVDAEAVETLCKIETPLTIVSVIGRYRTGKSSLLNGLVGTPTFATSSTVQAQTKGILIHRLDEKTLLMDTEGLGSMDVSRDHDAAIFALAMLVSSGCFFNNLGSITSQSIDDLHLATKVAGLLCRHAKFGRQLPSLVWIMRDFTLELCDRNNLPISADTYFEQCVDRCDPVKGQDLRSLFPSRRCLALARPTAEDQDLKEMRNLRPEFTDGIDNIRSLMRQFPAKTIGDQPMTGRQLCVLVEALCVSLNANAVPDLDDVWKQISRKSRLKATQMAQDAFGSAPSTIEGLIAAYDLYTETIIDDTVSGEEVFLLTRDLLRADTRGQQFEQQFVETKRAFDVYVATTTTEQEDVQCRIREGESNLASAHRKIARLVDEGLTIQHRLTEMELETAGTVPVQDSTELLTVLDGLQTKHKQLKGDLQEKQRLLDDAVQTIHVQDRTLAEHTHRLTGERKTAEEQRSRAHGLETSLLDLKSDLQQAKTDVAIWRSRTEDMTSRTEKKRKLSDDTYTELISLTSEVTFLRNRHDEDTKRLHTVLQEGSTLAQQVQTLQVKLALEIGK